MNERESHGMNCAYRSDSDEHCTCACRYHAAVDTERTMHAAWRKRAEEAERENADLRAESESRRKAWCVLRSALNAIAWTTYDNVAFAMRTAQDALAIGCPVANGRSDKAATDALTDEITDLRARLAEAEQDRDVAWADIAVLRVKVMQAEKARDEQAEAVRVLGKAVLKHHNDSAKFALRAEGDIAANPIAAAAVKHKETE